MGSARAGERPRRGTPQGKNWTRTSPQGWRPPCGIWWARSPWASTHRRDGIRATPPASRTSRPPSRAPPACRRRSAAAFYAALLHDVGVPLAASRLALRPCVDEDVVFAAEQPPTHTALSPQQREQAAQLRAVHTAPGADFLRRPWFPAATAEGVAAGHQNWDGSGDAGAPSGKDIPAVVRLLRAADLFDGAVAGETNPLTARARWSGRQIEPGIAAAPNRRCPLARLLRVASPPAVNS